MNRRKARFLVGLFGAAFLILLVFAFKGRHPSTAAPAVVSTDPKAVAEITGGRTLRLKGTREDVKVDYEKLLTYEDGSSRLMSVAITIERGDPKRTFSVIAKEGKLGQNESSIELADDVRMSVSDGLTAHTERATYSDREGTVSAAGPVEVSSGKMNGSGTGLRYDVGRDMLTIVENAVVHMTPDEKGSGAADITAGTATFARKDKYVQFERNVRIERKAESIEADTAIARLTADQKHIELLELHNHARITNKSASAGSLQETRGADMTLTYGADGQTLQHALVAGEAHVQLAGQPGRPGREIAAKSLDIGLAPDGSTPVSLVGQDSVELTFPPDGTTPARRIQAPRLEGSGEPGRGLTRALFTGGIQFRERGGKTDRAASASALEVVMKPGMETIDEARFVHAVKFEDGQMVATAAAAKYDVGKGSLALTGSEPGFAAPRVVNENITVDAAQLDVTLEGPIVNAKGSVKSTLQPSKKNAGDGDQRHLPSMLKQDQAVTVVADNLAYDGSKSSGTYTGSARLFQGADTTVKADEITIDEKRGDLTAKGHAMSSTMRDRVGKDKKTERVQQTATAADLRYEDGPRKLTYTGDAHMVGPEGDLTASKIELYLKPEGDELDHAEASTEGKDKLTLREQNRTTTGMHMTYTAEGETYVVQGLPATVIDECGRETIGRTLTFVRATDTIVVDGNQQIRTQTKGGSGKCQ